MHEGFEEEEEEEDEEGLFKAKAMSEVDAGRDRTTDNVING